MSEVKVLDIPYLELVRIAKAINENTLANKNREKDKKIKTDQFIKKFGINRKNFSATIKEKRLPIKYNSSTFLYDIDESFIESIDAEVVNVDKSTIKEKARKNLNKSKEKSEVIIVPEKFNDIKLFINNKDKFFEMLEWYEDKKEKEDIELNSISQRIDIDDYAEELQGEVSVKYLKIYTNIYKRYEKLFDKYPKISKQDMLSLALLLFCERFE
ncbi:hypothetical protein [Clostridium sp.]|jgi:hypothetical protein|uniref:hypothetical protein n=1 Tax=Clostridium sp. TaxID=1506 RepID=UPI00258C897C|nr:hypothetical protein [Clostridium sp.]MDF2505181.1 hypothetical protein [Clostridium sp.]